MINSKKLFSVLTRKELEALENVVLTGSVKGAARVMNISHRTIEEHIGHVKNKLGVQYKSQLNQIYIDTFYEKKV